MAAMDEQDVPPLEDMSELLQQVQVLRETKSNSAVGNSKPGRVTQTQQSEVKPEKESVCYEHSNISKSTNSSKNSFGGFKKGFLFATDKKTDSKKPAPESHSKQVENKTKSQNLNNTDNIPLIKAADPAAQKHTDLQMPEVQAAVNASQPLLQNKDWVTEDLLSKIQTNETLTKKLADPTFTQAIAEFQSNPQAAMNKYQNNMEVQLFFKEFAGILGQHFTKLGSSDSTQKPSSNVPPMSTSISTTPPEGAEISVHSSTNPKQPTAADEEQIQAILGDPEVRTILMDPDIQSLFTSLKSHPESVNRFLQTSDSDLKKKIKKLVDVGLLQFQT